MKAILLARAGVLRASLRCALLLPCLSAMGLSAQNLSFPAATSNTADVIGSSPSFATFNGTLYAAFRSNDSRNILYVTRSTDGVHFPAATGYPNLQMGSAPALAVFNNRLYVAFQANDSSHKLFITSSSDGVNFAAATGYPNILIGGTPSLAAFNGQLVAAFQANDASHALWTASSSDGVNFSSAFDGNDSNGGTPALAVLNGTLYVAFSSNDTRHVLYVTSSTTGTNFPAATAYPSIQMGTAPALAASNGALYVLFQSNDSRHLLYATASTSGANFPTATGFSSIAIGGTPSAAAFGNGLSVGFQANDPSNYLFATSNAAAGTSGGSASLPKHVLLGYWQDYTNGATPLTIAQVPTTFDIIAVAFGTATGTPGQVAFSLDSGLSSALGGYSPAQFTADIQTAHTRGQRVVLSVGGQNGAISVTDSPSASNFANSVSALMTQYGFDGVDIDLESGINPGQMAAAISQLKGLQPNALVTAAPQTVDVQNSGNDYFQFASAIGANMTMMNTQYYNSGTMLGCDGNVYTSGTENFLTALACTQLQGLAANTIGLGLPASTSAAGSGYTNPSVVVAAVQCLTSGSNCGSFHPPSTWPSLRGVMVYSINWDASNGYNFSNTVSPALRALP